MFEPDMEFVKNFTPPEFQAKSFTLSISPNFNSFSDKTQKMSKNGEIYTAGKNFTLPPAVTAVTNITLYHCSTARSRESVASPMQLTAQLSGG